MLRKNTIIYFLFCRVENRARSETEEIGSLSSNRCCFFACKSWPIFLKDTKILSNPRLCETVQSLLVSKQIQAAASSSSEVVPLSCI